METLTVRDVRRLALARAGLLRPDPSGLGRRASGRGVRARRAAQAVVERFGYLQLDTVSIAGARSHALVLHSRLDGFDPTVGEELLSPGAPLFEYWGHEASWLPLDLYPVMAFRREAFRSHPWWGDLIRAHPDVARDLVQRITDEGPLRSADMEGRGSRGWWDLKITRKVAAALWSSGELAIRERRRFQRSFDLTERVIPDALRERDMPRDQALEVLLLRALDGHGWATTSTLAQTFRLRRLAGPVRQALARLEQAGTILPCALDDGRKRQAGWIRPEHLEQVPALARRRPRRDAGVLLSPFDPLLWDRSRVAILFGFDQRLEIYKPEAQRRFGYFCLPVLAGERLVARVDLKAERGDGRLRILSLHFEEAGSRADRPARVEDGAATAAALARYAEAVQLEPEGWAGLTTA